MKWTASELWQSLMRSCLKLYSGNKQTKISVLVVCTAVSCLFNFESVKVFQETGQSTCGIQGYWIVNLFLCCKCWNKHTNTFKKWIW